MTIHQCSLHAVVFDHPDPTKTTSLGPVLRTCVAFGSTEITRVVTPGSVGKVTCFGAHGADSFIDYDREVSSVKEITDGFGEPSKILVIGIIGSCMGGVEEALMVKVAGAAKDSDNEEETFAFSIPLNKLSKSVATMITDEESSSSNSTSTVDPNLTQICVLLDPYNASKNDISPRVYSSRCDILVHIPVSPVSRHSLEVDATLGLVLHEILSSKLLAFPNTAGGEGTVEGNKFRKDDGERRQKGRKGGEERRQARDKKKALAGDTDAIERFSGGNIFGGENGDY